LRPLSHFEQAQGEARVVIKKREVRQGSELPVLGQEQGGN
jgi:hypothetical protein